VRKKNWTVNRNTESSTETSGGGGTNPKNIDTRQETGANGWRFMVTEKEKSYRDITKSLTTSAYGALSQKVKGHYSNGEEPTKNKKGNSAAREVKARRSRSRPMTSMNSIQLRRKRDNSLSRGKVNKGAV